MNVLKAYPMKKTVLRCFKELPFPTDFAPETFPSFIFSQGHLRGHVWEGEVTTGRCLPPPFGSGMTPYLNQQGLMRRNSFKQFFPTWKLYFSVMQLVNFVFHM
jgi:hypothetical protein